VTSMTCRLPQTPRTPTTAAAHYFDDVLSTTSKPKKPSFLRRSSTARSIGHRSDWENSTNGDDDDDARSPVRRKNSVGYLDEDAIKAKRAIQERLNNYVSGQLERVKTGMHEYEPDEFETSLDGTSEKPPRSSKKSNSRGNYFEQDPYFSK
jgi:hypothetical protein